MSSFDDNVINISNTDSDTNNTTSSNTNNDTSNTSSDTSNSAIDEDHAFIREFVPEAGKLIINIIYIHIINNFNDIIIIRHFIIN
jgi:hypothetical protein